MGSLVAVEELAIPGCLRAVHNWVIDLELLPHFSNLLT